MSVQAEDGFLYGVDFSFDQDTPPRVVAQFPPIDPRPPPPLNNILRAIPTQPSRTIRVIVEYFTGGGTKIDLFKPVAHKINKSTSTSLAEIIAQCHGNNENGTAWGFNMTSFNQASLNPQFGPDLNLKWWLPRARIFQDASHRITLYVNCEASMKAIWQPEWAEASKFCHNILLDFVHTMEHMDRWFCPSKVV
ncbi:hypothetical protein P171DRAFT_190611 [Karstenula rhodostoma CBS 690.94]|uniref:Uncharacterized protein n=1 Tax=Karstenula rhodostoma CBS 690.94 TaxID=1392251 RepID=A0A9P4PQ99_9PLEO|nr:hypothetical protein P171DRAFT_190611 [Karstenula rhodostoma CBS 690.94]